jgi:AraC family transcriptional regulator
MILLGWEGGYTMEWLDAMRNAIRYIEDHLDSDFDMDEEARAARSSKYHFQRMFHMLTGVTVAEYVRRRRMTLAAQELALSKVKIIDIALKYGYESPEAFTKVFVKLHGFTPSAAREAGVKLKAYPRLSFHISMIGDQDMNYAMVEKESYPVVGKAIRVSCKNGENSREIPKFWQQSHETGLVDRLDNLNDEVETIGICMDFDEVKEELTYMIAVRNTDDHIPDGLEERVIPAATWAVFESIGPMPDAIQKVWKRIYSEWFPASAYEHAGGPELEVYPIADASDENYRCQVWIPVVKKQF